MRYQNRNNTLNENRMSTTIPNELANMIYGLNNELCQTVEFKIDPNTASRF